MNLILSKSKSDETLDLYCKHCQGGITIKQDNIKDFTELVQCPHCRKHFNVISETTVTYYID